MATTFTQGWTKTSAGIKVFNELFKAAGKTASTNFVDLAQSYQLASQLEGTEAAECLASLALVRQAIRGAIQSSPGVLTKGLKVISRATGIRSTKGTLQGWHEDIRKYMIANSLFVNSRGFVRGSVSNGSPYVGSGTFKRVWIDADGYPLECGFSETYTLTCVKDQGLKVPFKGLEEFQLKGDPYVDELEWSTSGRGSDVNQSVFGVQADSSLLANASFSATPPGGDATPTSIPGWQSTAALDGDGTDILVDRTNYYQECKNDNGSPAALRFTESKTIYQPLVGLNSNNVPISTAVPYYPGIKIKANGNGQWTGTIVLTLGSKSISKTITTETGWIDLDLTQQTDGTQQTDLWYKNWNTNGAEFRIAVIKTSGASTYLLVARAMLVPYTPVRCPQTGGDMFHILALSDTTPWKLDDTASFTDAAYSAYALNQDWSHRTWGLTWPSRPVAPLTAPTAVLSGTAGVITSGNHRVAFSYVTTEGFESILSPVSGIVAADGTKKIDVSDILVGDTSIVARKVYMTKAGGSTYYLIATISDNTTTTAALNTADGSLTVEAPSATLVAEP